MFARSLPEENCFPFEHSPQHLGAAYFIDRYPAFVKAAKEMHEAKLPAEGGFKGSERMSVEQRYERAEKELFAPLKVLAARSSTTSPVTTAAV
ncbi:hypothetical protein [Arthrobacter sp. efr-133-TYG-120]|uniref:hypothetical protein n=1 Tax=Arthrobacter sp. efr-133-TYG-120 TaxID=3040280 RepID=UPI0033065D37